MPAGPIDKFGLEEVAARLTIGSLIVGAIGVGVDGFVDIRDFITYITGLAAWEPLIAIPVFFVSYFMGMLTIGLAASWFNHRRGDTSQSQAALLMLVSRQNGFLIEEYRRIVRELELLQAAGPALACAAIGLTIKALLAAPNIGGRLVWGRAIFSGVGVTLLALGLLASLLVRRTSLRLAALIAAFQNAAAAPP